MNERRRLDVWLVERGLAATRTLAQEMINAGQVVLRNPGGDRVLSKASRAVEPGETIEVLAGPADRYVSRGGLKLEGALDAWGIEVRGRAAVDAGQSTGGFTDCLLKRGARSVVGFDVGHGQLHHSLLRDPRVFAFEGVHFRELAAREDLLERVTVEGCDLLVVDLAFVSLLQALPALSMLPGARWELVALVKPQFELGAEALEKGGVVKDASLYPALEVKIREGLGKLGWRVLDWIGSSITGKDGNKEFFVHAERV